MLSSIEEITLQEVALKMLEDQVPLETIARYTGLSISKVERFAIEKVKELHSRQNIVAR